MNNKYADTFEQRGHLYDLAMQSFPDSRNNEFERLFDVIDMQQVKTVLDLPSGGGYLARHLPAHCHLTSVDPSQPFHTSEEIKYIDLENLDLPEQSYDLVITLAALHHVDNKKGFLTSVTRTLKPGGYCSFADVAAGSGIGRFLDEFAGTYNGTGHQGDYLEVDAPYPGLNELSGIKLVEHAIKPCSWVFSSEQDMVEFCRLLFGLKEVANHEILAALEKYVGVEVSGDGEQGTVQLKWELLYITMQKRQ